VHLDFGRAERQYSGFFNKNPPRHWQLVAAAAGFSYRIMAQPFNLWQPGPLLHYQPVLDAQDNTVKHGEGEFAAVFRYKNSNTGKQVAIKRMKLRKGVIGLGWVLRHAMLQPDQTSTVLCKCRTVYAHSNPEQSHAGLLHMSIRP
jgi:hypothetical protein